MQNKEMLAGKIDPHGIVCPICLCNYDQKERLPRIMLTCGHTFCTHCLKQLFHKNANIICPLDKTIFNLQNQGVEALPINFALKQVLEEKSKWELCRIHQEEMRLVCLNDRCKVCDECLETGAHQKHKLMPIKKVVSESEKKIQKLEETFEVLDQYHMSMKAFLEAKRKDILMISEKQFQSLYKALKQRETNLQAMINSHFRSEYERLEKSLNSDSSLKANILQRISRLRNFLEGDNLKTVFEELPSSMLKCDKNFVIQLMNKIQQGFDSFSKSFEGSFSDYHQSFSKIDLLKFEEVTISDINLLLGEHSNVLSQKRGKSIDGLKLFYDIEIKDMSLLIASKDPEVVDLSKMSPKEYDLKDLDKIKQIKLTLTKNAFSKKSFRYLQEIWSRLNEINFLKVDFIDSNVNDEDISIFCNLMVNQVPNIQIFDIWLEGCNVGESGFEVLFKDTLQNNPKIKKLSLNLRKTKLTDASLNGLAFQVLSKLEDVKALELFLGGTNITDEGITSMLINIKNLDCLKLDLQNTKTSDKSIETFAQCILPFMDSLTHFEIYLGSTAITDKSMTQLMFKTENIKAFKIDLQSTKITDKSLVSFAQNLLPFMKTVESLELYLWGTEITDYGFSKLCMKMKTLKNIKLDLSNTNISDLSLQAFLRVTLPSATALQNINIWVENSKVRDQSLLKQIREYKAR